MRRIAVIIIFLFLLYLEVFLSVANASTVVFEVCGFPASKTVQVRITDITTLSSPSEVLAFTSTGVVERLQNTDSCYRYSYASATNLHRYECTFKDNSTPVNEVTDTQLARDYPTNFADLAITSSTGKVAVITNDDKTGYTVSTVSDKTGYALSTAGVSAVSDETIEGTLTMRKMLRIMFSVLAGESSGGGTATITFRDIADTKNRLVTIVDTHGNRTSVTLNGD